MGDKLSVSDLMRVEHKSMQYQQLYAVCTLKINGMPTLLLDSSEIIKKLWKMYTFFQLKYMLFVLS